MIGIMVKAQRENAMTLKSHSLAFSGDLPDVVPWCGHHNLHVLCSEYAACMHNSCFMIAYLKNYAEPN